MGQPQCTADANSLLVLLSQTYLLRGAGWRCSLSSTVVLRVITTMKDRSSCWKELCTGLGIVRSWPPEGYPALNIGKRANAQRPLAR